MSSHLIHKKSQMFSQFFSLLKRFARWLFGECIDCQGINKSTQNSENRVSEINAAAPDCGCEKYPMSKDSPGVVGDSEQLALFIFLPVFKIGKDGKAKSGAFGHVHKKGRSIQRDSVATTSELDRFSRNFLKADEKFAWAGVLLAKCADVRNLKIENSLNRKVCVYDTADKESPAHGEMAQTQHIIDPDDEIELRNNLLEVFGKGEIIAPHQYRGGEIWNNLPLPLQAR